MSNSFSRNPAIKAIQAFTSKKLIIPMLLLMSMLDIIGSSSKANAQTTFYDDTAPYAWAYSAGWTVLSGGTYSGAYNGTIHSANLNAYPGGASAVFSCDNASYIAVYGTKAYNRVVASVLLDTNTNPIYVDLYDPLVKRQQLIYQAYVPRGRHIITIKDSGTKNRSVGSFSTLDVDYGVCSP